MTSTSIDVHRLPNLRLQAYWAIEELTLDSKDRFSSSEIANYLIENAGVKTSRQAIQYTLQSKSANCHKNKHGFKLMQDAKNELYGSSVGLTLIEAGKPYIAKNFALKEIIGDKYSKLSVCDPYLDLNTLDVIYKNFIKGLPIRILTANVIDKPQGIFKRQLSDLNKEGFKIEVRIYNKSTLHDRYIISEKQMWLCGNSLNHMGNKESFIVSTGEDIKQSVLSTFNSRWKTSQIL